MKLAVSTLVELLRERSAGSQRDYTFLLNGDTEGGRITFRELWRRACAIGALLQQQGAQGERVLLLQPPGLDFVASFFGCLCGGAIAVPAYPPMPPLERTVPRLHAIVKDAQARFLIASSGIAAMAKSALGQDPGFASVRWLTFDDVPPDAADLWKDPGSGPSTLAFLQYTSGSTGSPQGVMLTHANLLANSAHLQEGFSEDSEDTWVSWLPPYHDMGLIAGVLHPLFLGSSGVLMSPLDFLQRPLRWLRAITKYRGRVSGGPNFAYDLCVRKITPEEIATLDLSSWTLAFNGAEPVNSETLDRFSATFKQCGFRPEAFLPCYGLAEGTLYITGIPRADNPLVYKASKKSMQESNVVRPAETEGDANKLVSCGMTRSLHRVVITNPETHVLCPEGTIGEIWAQGPSIAQGYWNRPEKSELTFHAKIEGASEQGPFLRTGDLGFQKDGNLYVTGRIKDLIIVRGRKHHPQDIERTAAASHDSLRPGCCAAFSIENNGEEQIVIAVEVERRYQSERRLQDEGVPGDDRRSATRRTNDVLPGNEAERGSLDMVSVTQQIRRQVVAAHGLAIYAVVLLKPGTIPKTSSGKIQRYQCRLGFQAGTLDAIHHG
jgi:acyl-CoA synthetase (AMP-forming)/AMP-acid ligase II